ncbi:hypothetical protein AAE478_000459 [Parahypoxylon ruwenzoriense]
MYAGNYGFPNAIPPAGSQYNGGAPHPAASPNTHLQPGQGPPNQHHPMYNTQQFPMGVQPGVGFPGAPNMMPGPAAAGMMQNAGMPHMAAANGPMPNYQPPYTNSPYGAAVPTSVAPQMNMPPNYAMGGGMPMSGFPMHPGINPQQQQVMQRMQPHQPNTPGMGTPTQRPFQGHHPQSTPTPNNASATQQHPLSTPQHIHSTPPTHTLNNAQHQSQHQPPSNNIQTPQTPVFPPSAQGNAPSNNSSGSAPLSPGPDSRDKERVGIILEINNELLLEAMQIQHTQQVLKKERTSSNSSDPVAPESEKKPTEEEDILAQDYLQLQTNLTYLAALADKKGNVTVAPCPTYLRAPPLNTSIKLKMISPDGSDSQDASDRNETAKYIQELYRKLQGLYPGIDPNKEPTYPLPPARQGTQPANAAKPGTQTSSQPSPVPGKQKTPKMATSAPPPSAANSVAGS